MAEGTLCSLGRRPEVKGTTLGRQPAPWAPEFGARPVGQGRCSGEGRGRDSLKVTLRGIGPPFPVAGKMVS